MIYTRHAVQGQPGSIRFDSRSPSTARVITACAAVPIRSNPLLVATHRRRADDDVVMPDGEDVVAAVRGTPELEEQGPVTPRGNRVAVRGLVDDAAAVDLHAEGDAARRAREVNLEAVP